MYLGILLRNRDEVKRIKVVASFLAMVLPGQVTLHDLF